jgi:hypothetical protein
MKNLMQNRRDFLKTATVAAGLSQLPFLGWGNGFSALRATGVNLAGEFSLLKLETLLSVYKFPVVDHFSTSSFGLDYRLYNLYGENAVSAGEFHLKSSQAGTNRNFDFAHWRWADNGIKNREKRYRYIVSGHVTCDTDEFISPRTWKTYSRIALNEESPAFYNTGLQNEGDAGRGEVTIQTNGKPIRKAYGSLPLCWKWGLPAVVQKMAEASMAELQFALLDEFDAIHQHQRMVLRKKVKLDCGVEHPVEFKVFELTGDGVIPTVYWVDNHNRTVFVISGMEAYVLN